MANNVSQKCVPNQSWPVTYDNSGNVIWAGPPIIDTTRLRYECSSSHPTSQTDMRRKAEVLQHKKNSFQWTKQQRFAYLSKHPTSRPSQAGTTTVVLPTGPAILCNDSFQSGIYVLPSGDDGTVLSSPSASNVPRDPYNDVPLYYDVSIPLTNWSKQTQFTEIGGYDGEIVKLTFEPEEIILPPILTDVIFPAALRYYFDGSGNFSNDTKKQLGRFDINPLAISLWDVSNVTDMSGAFKDKIDFNVNIDNWNVTNVTDMSGMFFGCSNFNQTLNKWGVSKVKNMSNMFFNCGLFDKPLKYWDVSNVTNMSGMFEGCVVFNRTINTWKVSNVINMSKMFSGCSGFNQELSTWDVAKVTNMTSMFNKCSVFNQPLSTWDVAKVTNMTSMFNECIVFNQILSSWNVANVASLTNMFKGCSTYNQGLRGWVLSINTVLNVATGMFSGTSLSKTDIDDKTIIDASGTPIQEIDDNLGTTLQNYFTSLTVVLLGNVRFRSALMYYFGDASGGIFTSNDLANIGRFSDQPENISYWDVSEVTDMSGTFLSKNMFNQNINTWDVSNVTDMSGIFSGCTSFNQPLNKWSTNNVTNMTNMFYQDSSFNQPLDTWIVEKVTNMEKMFYECESFTQSLRVWEISVDTLLNNATNMFQYTKMVTGINGSIIIDASNGTPTLMPPDQLNTNYQNYFLKTSYLYLNDLNFNAAIEYYFNNMNLGGLTYRELNQVGNYSDNSGNISYWDVSAVTNMNGAFTNKTSFNINIGGWDVSNVTNMHMMFSGCSNFNQELTSWNVSNVVDMSYMFNECVFFDTSLYGWNTTNVKNMEWMFNKCHSFNKNINNFDVSNVTDMSNMFRECLIYNQPLDRWVVTNVLKTVNMFRGCTFFNKTINNWDLYNADDVSGMFYGCVSYEQSLNDWVLPSVINISNMLNGCENYNQPFDNLDLYGATNISGMFSGCLRFNQKLEWNVSNVTSMNSVFNGCLSFDASINSWNVSNVTDMRYMFYDCKSFNSILSNWTVSKVTTFAGMFNGCEVFNGDLSGWDISSASSVNSMFYNCTKFNWDLSGWDMSSVFDMKYLFGNCYELGSSSNINLRQWAININANTEHMFENTQIPTTDVAVTIIDNDGTPINIVGNNAGYANYFISPISLFLNDVRFAPAIKYYFDGSNTIGFNDREKSQIGRYISNNNGISSTRTNISYWDVSYVTDMSGAFKNRNTFNENLDRWDVSNAVYMTNMFNGCTDYNQLLYNWDVSKVTNTSNMFRSCLDFNQPLNNWNVSNVNDMSGMFYGCTNFNQPLNNWSVSKVTDMSNMFNNCLLLNNQMNTWDVSKVTNMRGMFNGCTSLAIELRMWNVDIISNLYLMFADTFSYSSDGSVVQYIDASDNLIDASGSPYIEYFNCATVIINDDSFNESLINYFGSYDVQYHNLGNHLYNPGRISYWDVSRVTDMSGAFKNRNTFNENLDRWNVSKVNDMSGMFNDCTKFNQPLSTWDVSRVTNMNSMFRSCSDFNQPLNKWNVSYVNDMNNMFNGCTKFNQPLNEWNVSSATNMNSMFYECRTFDQDLISWDVSNVTSMNNMFYNCLYFKKFLEIWYPDISGIIPLMFYKTGVDVSLNDVSNNSLIDSSGNTDSRKYFIGRPQLNNETFRNAITCYFDGSGGERNIGNYKDASFNKSSYISYWDVSGVTDMSGAFNTAHDFNVNINNWNVSTVIDMSGMFYGCSNFNQPLSNWDVSGVTIMSNMFRSCSDFNQNLENWSVYSVQNLENMFRDCKKFEQTLRKWRPPIGVISSQMFSNTSAYPNQLDLRGTNIYIIDSSGSPSIQYFRSSLKLDNTTFRNALLYYFDMSSNAITGEQTSIIGQFLDTDTKKNISFWDVSSVTDMSGAFKDMGSTFNEDLNYWDVSSVTDMSNIFNGCQLFNQSLELWSVSKVTNMRGMFYICSNFDHSLNMWDVSSVTNMSEMFYGCSKLNKNLHNWDVSKVENMGKMFYCNTNLNQTFQFWRPKLNVILKDMFTGSPEIFPTTTDNIIRIANGTPTYTYFIGRIILNDDDFISAINYYFRQTGSERFTRKQQIKIGNFADSSGAYHKNNITSWDVSNVTDMSGVFNGESIFNENISLWDLSSATNTNNMFNGCTSFNQSLNVWDVSNVKNMSNMFNGCTSFNHQMNAWDVSRVTYMSNMFYNDMSFNQPLNNWNVSSVIDMSGMFYGCAIFNQPLNNWNVSNVTEMSNMFNGCSVFRQDLLEWDVSTVTDMNNMFRGCNNFNRTSLRYWSKLLNNSQTNMFLIDGSDNTKTLNGTDILIDDGGTPTDDYFIIYIDILYLTDVTFKGAMDHYFGRTDDMSYNTIFDASVSNKLINYAPELKTASVKNSIGYYDSKLTDITANSLGYFENNISISKWNVNDVTDMSGAFLDTTFDLSLNEWNVSRVTNMNNMFNGCTKFNQPLNEWIVSSATNMNNMFNGCTEFNQPLNKWDVSRVIDMSGMFYGCAIFNQQLSTWNVKGEVNMTRMFNGCSSFPALSLRTWTAIDVSSSIITSMFYNTSGLFVDASNVTVIDSSGTPTADYIPSIDNGVFKPKDSSTFSSALRYYFDGVQYVGIGSDLIKIGRFNDDISKTKISGWDVSEVIDMSFAFQNRSTFNIDVSLWDVSNVENMYYMFDGATSFFSTLIGGWDVSKVTNFSYMFNRCTSFNLDYTRSFIPLYDTIITNSGATRMFAGVPGVPMYGLRKISGIRRTVTLVETNGTPTKYFFQYMKTNTGALIRF